MKLNANDMSKPTTPKPDYEPCFDPDKVDINLTMLAGLDLAFAKEHAEQRLSHFIEVYESFLLSMAEHCERYPNDEYMHSVLIKDTKELQMCKRFIKRFTGKPYDPDRDKWSWDGGWYEELD
mgnify:CR=1 FL=1